MAAEKPAAPPVTLESGDGVEKMSANERIKVESQGLFYVSAKGEVHTFLDEVRSLDTGEAETLSGGAKELSKFFGIYKQQARGDRGKKLKDPRAVAASRPRSGPRSTMPRSASPAARFA